MRGKEKGDERINVILLKEIYIYTVYINVMIITIIIICLFPVFFFFRLRNIP